MEIIVNVPVERLEFALEVLRNLTFVESARPRKASKTKVVEQDTTEYLQASPANAARLNKAYEQLDRVVRIDYKLPAESPVHLHSCR